jgi:hypothetical protein
MDNTEVDPLTGAINDNVQIQHTLTDSADGNEAQIGYGSKLKDIKQMGLA